MQVLTAAEVTTLDALGDVLLPGAAAAGFTIYTMAERTAVFLLTRWAELA